MIEEFDLIGEEEQVCNIVYLMSEDDELLDTELTLNIFKFNLEFEANETQYDEIRREIIRDARLGRIRRRIKNTFIYRHLVLLKLSI